MLISRFISQFKRPQPKNALKLHKYEKSFVASCFGNFFLGILYFLLYFNNW